jgi:fimbrial chaperone protein
MPTTRTCPAFAALLLLLVAQFAAAGSFSLSPVGLSIPSHDSSASVVAENTGTAPIVIQVKTFAWRQENGSEVRDDTRELIVNPPLFKLGPGEQQLVRIASRMGPPAEREVAYRVVFTEIVPKDVQMTQPGFRFALAMDIPVYIEPVAKADVAPVRFTAERTPQGVRVTAENPGSVHYRIVDTEFAAAGKVLKKQASIVVLPRSSMVYELPAVPPGTSSIHLSADDGASHSVSIDIALPAP